MFETLNAKKYCVASGVALQTPTPLHTRGQKKRFWVPRMVVFEMHDAKKYSAGSGVALEPPTPLHTMGQKNVFGYLGWQCLKCMMPKILGGFWGGDPTCHTSAQKGPEKLFLVPRMMVFETLNAKNYCVASEVVLQTPIPM